MFQMDIIRALDFAILSISSEKAGLEVIVKKNSNIKVNRNVVNLSTLNSFFYSFGKIMSRSAWGLGIT